MVYRDRVTPSALVDRKKLAPKIAVEVRVPSTRWIPEAQRGTDWYICHELYLVNVPWLQTQSVEDLRHFGVPMTGDPEYDKQVKNEVRALMLPIDKMAELYEGGAEIGIINYADTRRIYERIEAHLEAWAKHLKGSLNQLNAPVKDLLLLDKFAHSVYEFAKWEFLDADSFMETIMGKINGQTMSMSLASLEQRILAPIIPKEDPSSDRVKILGPKEKPTPEQVKEDEKDERAPERRSMADNFLPRRGTAASALKKAGMDAQPARTVSPSIAALLGNSEDKT